MRTIRYRLVLWLEHESINADSISLELFDHKTDPSESINLASEFPGLARRLTEQFRAGWEKAL